MSSTPTSPVPASAWVAGARPRTLPAALAPVLAGTGTALAAGSPRWGLAALALVVSLALQVGVNYANDYSDGIRGTDADRVGPMRLVGSGTARPAAVKRAAFGCFAVAAVAGLVLVALSGQWWLLLVGAASIAAAWYYTGGRRPYGYAGWGEVFVFVFFGLVAVCGTTLVQTGGVDVPTVAAAVAVGALACALLVANNLRDVHGDREVGKRTLATRLGERGTRLLYLGLVLLAVAGVVVVAATTTWLALLGLGCLVLLVPALRAVLGGATGRALVPVLQRTGMAELLAAVGLFAGLALG
ncbi:1,4-dihydroxy-2-naphthoate polyprenyltransferase [Auraticoccus sp. F435]|uniref:1,4-dihydroxy-2-naphthoate octaprenyltransferase n=1 Tax=Auraticoccus cholistanensis TaxID=2656650 RepID=A0A6A9UVA8_9ACTN|nr:1,4-dihydroxy-2-naphthoate polyprenyltransferase [Auraticoccus cholistanensis]MVA75504.1 1,4-dihydroxy-2-naphthoate polyprenyltransferase [Auraticoccus cholistanensis]